MNHFPKMIVLFLFIGVYLIGCEKNSTDTEGNIVVKTPEKHVSEVEEYLLDVFNPIHPDLNGHDIIFSDGKHILDYNIESKNKEIVFKSEFSDSSVQNIMTNDDWTIWMDASADGSENRIYAMNNQTKEKQMISKSDPNYMTADAPYLSDHYVAWIYLETENEKPLPVLKLHDLKNKKTIIVSKIDHYGLYNNFVHMDNQNLLWTDHKDGHGFYKIYNIPSKETKTLQSPFQYPSYAELSDNKIFALHFNDLSDKWGSQEFGYYDIENEKYNRFYNENKMITMFRVYKDKLSIIDGKGKLENYTVGEMGIEANRLDIHHEGIDNLRYTSDGKLMFTYLNTEDQKNYFVVVD